MFRIRLCEALLFKSIQYFSIFIFDNGHIMPANSLEFIQSIFKAISEDSSIPYEIKPYLMGLNAPLIKESNDKCFLSDALHAVTITLILLK